MDWPCVDLLVSELNGVFDPHADAETIEEALGVLETKREEMKSREIVDSYGEVLVSALKSDPTVCLVEFSFTVAHGLNRIYLTAHITV